MGAKRFLELKGTMCLGSTMMSEPIGTKHAPSVERRARELGAGQGKLGMGHHVQDTS